MSNNNTRNYNLIVDSRGVCRSAYLYVKMYTPHTHNTSAIHMYVYYVVYNYINDFQKTQSMINNYHNYYNYYHSVDKLLFFILKYLIIKIYNITVDLSYATLYKCTIIELVKYNYNPILKYSFIERLIINIIISFHFQQQSVSCNNSKSSNRRRATLDRTRNS